MISRRSFLKGGVAAAALALALPAEAVVSSTVVEINDTTATALATGLRSIILFTDGNNPRFFIGGSDVSQSNGFPVLAGIPFPIPIELAALETIYGLCPTGTGPYSVNVLRYSLL